MLRSSGPFRWFTVAVLLALTLPWAVQRGMFMDGLLYVTVAHNQAHGFGSFWEPRFSQEGLAGLSGFHEHPPLAFGMEALWFRALGDGFWVEGAYCLLMAALTAWLLVLLWRGLWPVGHPYRALGWSAVLLWIIVPQVHWCVQNNMQENTMAVFTVAAVALCIHAARQGGRSTLLYMASGLMTLCACLVKGPPGLFPLAAPFIYSVIADRQNWHRGLIGSVVATLVVGVGFLLLFQWPEARTSLLTYTEGRLLHRIDVAPTVDFRWRTIQHLFLAMLGPLLLTGALILLARKKLAAHAPDHRNTLALIAIGLCGVAPLMLTMVQKSFYMVAALPMISVGLASAAAPALSHWTIEPGPGPRLARMVAISAWFIIAAVLVVSIRSFGRSSRDADLLHDVDLIGTTIPAHSLVAAEPAIWDQWNLQSYLMRYHYISLCVNCTSEWQLTARDAIAPEGHLPVAIPTRQVSLWRATPKAVTGPGQ